MGEYSIVARAQTGNGTNLDGTRAHSTSAVETIQLNGNEYFNPADPNVYKLEVLSTKGETDQHVEWEDYAEPFPGLSLPRKLTFYTACWSPKVPPLRNVGVLGIHEVRLTAKSIEIGS